MSKVLYDNTSKLDIGGQRSAVVISRTKTGISVQSISLYSDEPTTTRYYHNYPNLPEAWDACTNEYGPSYALCWLRELQAYKPYRVVGA